MPSTITSLLVNWKTTLAAIISIIGLIGPIAGFLTPEQANWVLGGAQVFGLSAAKDANVTGGTSRQ